jgi:hypothetical protein
VYCPHKALSRYGKEQKLERSCLKSRIENDNDPLRALGIEAIIKILEFLTSVDTQNGEIEINASSLFLASSTRTSPSFLFFMSREA